MYFCRAEEIRIEENSKIIKLKSIQACPFHCFAFPIWLLLLVGFGAVDGGHDTANGALRDLCFHFNAFSFPL